MFIQSKVKKKLIIHLIMKKLYKKRHIKSKYMLKKILR